MNLHHFWTKWATAIMLALRVGALDLAGALIAAAFEYALAVLDALGIQYGPRLAPR